MLLTKLQWDKIFKARVIYISRCSSKIHIKMIKLQALGKDVITIRLDHSNKLVVVHKYQTKTWSLSHSKISIRACFLNFRNFSSNNSNLCNLRAMVRKTGRYPSYAANNNPWSRTQQILVKVLQMVIRTLIQIHWPQTFSYHTNKIISSLLQVKLSLKLKRMVILSLRICSKDPLLCP